MLKTFERQIGKEVGREKEGELEKRLTASGSLPKWWQWSRLGRSWQLELQQGPPARRDHHALHSHMP